MSEDDVSAALTTFIKENLAQDAPYDIDEDTPLLELGILDSLKTAMLLNYIRDGLGTPVPPQLIDAANFRSIRTIAALVGSLTSTRN
ncbi:acyl carrier protein [Micromonospora sp. HK10]|uniref:Acyl carrier protein n=1 Tax=Micromonospora sp. GMKU326 TaxID=718015 RepID=A0A0B6VQ00_9ACTN|nr:acyl carrier protein [Micromonospora sp. HK10]KKK06307.1 hypothetical protein LQ51_09070 [Micromonospora sp. HK10]BAQ25508.1 acyl carrier protein [Micromonospora sp. GMKU326]